MKPISPHQRATVVSSLVLFSLGLSTVLAFSSLASAQGASALRDAPGFREGQSTTNHDLHDVGEVVFSVGPAQVLLAAKKGEAAAPVQAVLSRGFKLSVGDQIVTGAGGHVHVRFVDGAFVAVRSDSQLTIEHYSYRADQPERSTVKFQLSQGTARSITGRAGEASKDRFRLNTPVAAIGVRGTDFVVLTQDAESRAVVNRGAIVVAPIGQGCLAEGFGPCSHVAAKELTPSMGDLMARVERGQVELVAARGIAPERSSPTGAEPRAIQQQKDGQSPAHPTASTPSSPNAQGNPASSAVSVGSSTVSPTIAAASSAVIVSGGTSAVMGTDTALPAQDKSGSSFAAPRTEQAALERVQGASGTGAGTAATVNPPLVGGGEAATVGASLDKSAIASGSADSTKPNADSTKPSDQQSVSVGGAQNNAQTGSVPNTYGNPLALGLKPPTLQWGRWAAQPLPGDQSEAAIALMVKGANAVMSASDWSLYTLGSSQTPRPREGMVDFVLRDALAYYQPVLGAATQAEVLSGSLGMDFAKATFSSRLNAKHEDLGQTLVMIHGTISADGQLQSAADSPASATGVLANNASEAAYRFSQRVTDTKGRIGSLFGLTRWGR